MPVADVRFGPGAPAFEHLPQSGTRPRKEGKHSGMHSYIHKIKDGRHIYYFTNSTDDPIGRMDYPFTRLATNPV